MSDDCFSPVTQRILSSRAKAGAAAGTTEIRPVTQSTSAAATGSQDDKGSNVQVVVRCRPPTDSEKRIGDIVLACVNQSEVKINANLKGKALNKMYTFDQSYGQLATQEEVYHNAVKPLVDEVLNGFNCTVFAYGQTGTGKTHTMEGQMTNEGGDGISRNAGIIPRSVYTIFDQLEKQKLESSVKVSFLELYNEELTDLLSEEDENGEHKELRIFEDQTGKRGMLVNNLEEIIVNNAQEVFQLMQKSWQKRRTAETLLNKNSSRSHCVFTITVHTKEYNEDGEDIIKSGKLYLVDLAGSECVGKSGAQNQRAKEAGKINQSLLTLGRVINALVDKAGYVPYRDSKLTRLLQESLGGRAKTVIIATVSPSIAAIDETLSTLEYAHRAKNIRNRPQVNQKMTRRAYMKELLDEINSLKRENEVLRLKNGIYLPPEKYEALMLEQKGKTLQLEEYLFTIKAKENELKEVQDMLTERDQKLQNVQEERALLQVQLDETAGKLDETKVALLNTENQLIHTKIVLGANKLELRLTEKDLQHSKYIARSHAETEVQLHQEIERIINTLDGMVAEKSELHNKIERKTIVERHNAMAGEAFQARFNGAAQEIKENFDSFAKSHGESIGKTRGMVINEAAAEFDSQAKQMTEELSSFEQKNRAAWQTVSSGQTGIRENALAFQRSVAQLQSSQASQRASQWAQHFDQVGQRVSALGQSVTGDWRAINEETFQSTLANMQKQAEADRMFQGKIHAALQQSSTLRSSSHQALTGSLASHSGALESFLTAQSSVIRSRTENLMKNVSAMIQEHERQCQEELRAGVAALMAQLGAAREAVNSRHEEAVTLDRHTGEVQQQFQSAQQHAHDSAVAQLKSNQMRAAEFERSMASRINDFAAEIETDRSNVANAADKQQNEFRQTLGQQDIAFNSLDHKQKDAIDIGSSLIASDYAPVVARFSAIHSSTSSDFSSIAVSLDGSAAQLAAYEPRFHSDLLVCEKSVSDYLGRDYQLDQPTGRTPQKREIIYQRYFPVTAAHPEIIQEYETKQSSASSAEEDEHIQLAIAERATMPHQPLSIPVPEISTSTAAKSAAKFVPIAAMQLDNESVKEQTQTEDVQAPAEEPEVSPSQSQIQPAAAARRTRSKGKSTSSAPVPSQSVEVEIDDSAPVELENITPNLPSSGTAKSAAAGGKAFNFARPIGNSRLRVPNLGNEH